MSVEVSRIFISSKYTTQDNYFKTLDEAIAAFNGDFTGMEIVFQDSKNNITPEQFVAVKTASAIFGNIGDDEWNTQAKNALTLVDAKYEYVPAEGVEWGEEGYIAPLFIEHFLTVSVNNSDLDAVFSKHNFETYKEKTDTYTYKFDGSFTAMNSDISSVDNYKTVSLLNTSVGEVYLDDLVKLISDSSERSASGTFTVRLSETAEDGKVYEIGPVSGYSKVTISGLNDELFAEKQSAMTVERVSSGKGLSGVFSGIIGDYEKGSENHPEKEGYYCSSGSITISDNVTVNNVDLFATVTLKNAVAGVVRSGDTYSRSVKRKKNVDGGYDGTETVTVKSSSKLTADFAVVGNIYNYNTVQLNNIKLAGNISRNTLTKVVRKSSGWDDIDYDYADSVTATYSAGGSLTVKANASFKPAEDDSRVMFIGNVDDELAAVSGYSKVTISGFVHKNDRSLDVAVSVNGDIVGGNEVYEDNGEGAKTTSSSAGTVTLGPLVSVNGNIGKFTTVTLGDSTVNGNIDRGDLTVSEKESKIKKSKKTLEDGDKYVEYSWSNTLSYNSEGKLTASGASAIAGDIKNYQTVTLTNSDAGNISRDTFAKQVDSYEYEDWMNEGLDKENKQLTDSVRTYSAGGTLTIKADKNFVAGSDGERMISIGRSVTPDVEDNTGSTIPDVEDNTGSTIPGDDDYIDGGDDDYIGGSDDENFGGSDDENFGGGDDGENTAPAEPAKAAAIEGYSKVTVSGYRDKKNSELNVKVGVTGSIIGGSRVEEVKKTEYGSIFDPGNYQLSSESSAGSVTVSTDVTVDGNVEGFTTVTLKDNAVINGDIERRGFKVTEKTKTEKGYSSSSDYQDRTITTTKTYKGDGKLTATNSRTGNITNYQTVTLTNTHAGDITRDQLAKEDNSLFQYRWKEDGEWSDWESSDGEEPTHKWYTSSGSLTVKADKTALNNAEKVEPEYDLDFGEYYDDEETEYRFNIGNISGYEKVTLTGYDKLDCHISVKNISGGNSDYNNEYSKNYSAVGSVALNDVMASGSISGFDKVTLAESEVDGKVIATDKNTAAGESAEYYICGSVSEKYSGSSEFSSDYSSSTTVKSAAKFTATDSCIGMTWNEDVILGYKTVSVTDESHINGGINFGDAFAEKFESKTKKGKTTETYSYKETKDGSLTVKDSHIYGSVTGYNKVTVTNSGIGYQGFDEEEQWLGEVRNWAYSSSATIKVDSETWDVESSSAKEEFKASGSFTCTIDKKAEYSAYHIGSVAGFDKVTISGYNGAKMVVNGSIRGGKVVSSGTANGVCGGIEWNDYTSAVSASGSVSISKNVLVEDDILGFNKVSISNSRVDDIDSIPFSDDFLDYGEDINWGEVEVVGSSVSLSDAFADDIYGYKSVTASGKYNEIESYSGTSSDDTFKVSKNSALRLASLDFREGTKDKLVIDGTLIFAANEEAGIAINGVDSISGKGEIAASSADLETVKAALDGKFSKFLDLGATSEGFRGRKEEAADNKEKNAVKWDISMDEEYTGWLGGEDLAFSDTVDYIKVSTDDWAMNLNFEYAAEEGYTVLVKDLSTGGEIGYTDGYYALAADSDYMIEMKRVNGKDSTSYTISAAFAEIG